MPGGEKRHEEGEDCGGSAGTRGHPNIGPVVAPDLHQLGINLPSDLKGQDPYILYQQPCAKTGVMHAACLLDTFIAATRFTAGNPPLPWWRYTRERTRTLKTS